MDEAPARKHSRTIGDLDGPWSTIFRVMLVFWVSLTPILIPWFVWQTKNAFNSSAYQLSTERINREDLRKTEEKIRQERSLSIGGLEAKLDALQSRMISLERSSDRQSVILQKIEENIRNDR